jgi:hypothetical protein
LRLLRLLVGLGVVVEEEGDAPRQAKLRSLGSLLCCSPYSLTATRAGGAAASASRRSKKVGKKIAVKAGTMSSPSTLRVLLGLSLAGWPMFLLGGCVDADSYWPMFNVFLLALGALPMVFGSLQSQGLWGAIGDFTLGAVLCSLFAFPMVLKNSEVIPLSSMILIWVGNLCLIAAALVYSKLVS